MASFITRKPRSKTISRKYVHTRQSSSCGNHTPKTIETGRSNCCGKFLSRRISRRRHVQTCYYPPAEPQLRRQETKQRVGDSYSCGGGYSGGGDRDCRPGRGGGGG